MATLQKENFDRHNITTGQGRSNNCVPSIMAAFLNIDLTASEEVCQGYPARNSGRKYGGTRIQWANPAKQMQTSYGSPMTDMVDCSENTNYSLKKHGSVAAVARNLSEGAYMLIHKGHAFGLLVVDGKAYTVDYGGGNHARRVVWTCTRLDSVNAREILAKLRGESKPKQKESRTYSLRLDSKEMQAVIRTVNVRTKDGNWHSLKTAQDSREFVREHGADATISQQRWDAIHDLQF